MKKFAAVTAVLAVLLFGFLSCQMESGDFGSNPAAGTEKAALSNPAASVQAFPDDLIGTIWKGATPIGTTATVEFLSVSKVLVDYDDPPNPPVTYNYTYPTSVSPNLRGIIDGPIGAFTVYVDMYSAQMDFDDWWGHGDHVVLKKIN